MPTRRQLLFGRFTSTDALRPVFGDACLPVRGVVCRSCGEACADAAITFPPAMGGVSLPVLHSALCTACGDCAKFCPVGALSLARDDVSLDFPEELSA